MSSFNPKLIISTYFDSLARLVDIHTEQALAKYTDDDVFEIKPDDINYSISLRAHQQSTNFLRDVDFDSIEDIFKFVSDPNIFRHDFQDYENNLEPIEEPSRPIKTRDYFNRVREEMLRELRKAEEQAFIRYESIKNDELKKKLDETNDMEDKKDLLFSLLFAKKFYLILLMEERYQRSFESPFRLYLVELNFYLNKRERDLLG